MKVNAVGLKGTCPHCHEEVEIVVTKKQLKALLKGMKVSTAAEAEIICELTLGRDRKGDLKR